MFSTGLVLQELLQGFPGPEAKVSIVERFASLPLLVPDRDDHIAAASLRNACRRAGVQVGTIDALLARLCSRHDLVMLTPDLDFPPLLDLVDTSVLIVARDHPALASWVRDRGDEIVIVDSA